MPPGASLGAKCAGGLRCNPWNLIRLIPAKGVRRPRIMRQRCASIRQIHGASAMATGTPRAQPPRPPEPPAVPPAESYAEVFPRSTKVYLEGPRGVRVPVREIAQSDGEPPVRV